MKPLLRRIASLRLTLFLLLALAVFGALGSAVPQGLDPSEYRRRYPGAAQALLALGFDHYYTGPFYRSLLVLLAVNLLACSLRRSAQGWRSAWGRGRPSLRRPLGDRARWVMRFRRLGFRISSEAPLRASRRPWAFVGFPLVHLAPLAILAGGLSGSLFGFVGTRNVHVGDTMGTVYSWSSRSDQALPVAVAVEDLRFRYYPTELRVRVELPGREPFTVQLRVGQVIDLAGTDRRLRIEDFDPATGQMTYWIEGSEETAGPFSKGREEGAPFRVRPVGYRDPELRRAEVLVAVRSRSGEAPARSTVAVNEPLVIGGLRIYLTAWDRDAYGFDYVGFQVVRDPGQPLVWAGAVGLSAGLLLLLFGNGAWAREEGGELLIGASRGCRQIEKLLAASDHDGSAEMCG